MRRKREIVTFVTHIPWKKSITQYLVQQITQSIINYHLLHVHHIFPDLCILPDDDLVDVETSRRDVRGKWLFITGCAICWIKYSIVIFYVAALGVRWDFGLDPPTALSFTGLPWWQGFWSKPVCIIQLLRLSSSSSSLPSSLITPLGTNYTELCKWSCV